MAPPGPVSAPRPAARETVACGGKVKTRHEIVSNAQVAIHDPAPDNPAPGTVATQAKRKAKRKASTSLLQDPDRDLPQSFIRMYLRKRTKKMKKRLLDGGRVAKY